MSIAGKIVAAINTGIDSKISGQLTKAVLKVHDDDKANATHIGDQILTFQFNPETIQVVRSTTFQSTPVHGSEDVGHVQRTGVANTSKLILSNIVFDTYELKPAKSVYDYIKILELFAGYDKEKHAPAWLTFAWGDFTAEKSKSLAPAVYIDKLDVKYTMFLPNGKPVRAVVNISFNTGSPPAKLAEQKQTKSPDHAKLRTIKRGDTLADIAFQEYDDSSQWRRIAEFNGIDDPMNLKPGSKLMVPPIL